MLHWLNYAARVEKALFPFFVVIAGIIFIVMTILLYGDRSAR